MTDHPLLDTLGRARQLAAHMEAIQLEPQAENWYTISDLVAPDGTVLPTLLEGAAVHFNAGKNRRAPASLFFGDIAFALMALASSCYLLDRRVPLLTVDTVCLTFAERGDVEGIALRDLRFAALADDPAADHSDCTVLPSEDALQEHLLAQAVECLQTLIQAVRAHSPLGVPAMWALAADYTASSAAFVGRAMKRDAEALDFARQLAAKQSPLRRKRDFIHIEACGQSYEMVDRLSCCLYYQVEGGRYCFSCPHRPQEERIGLIEKWLTETAAKQQAA